MMSSWIELGRRLPALAFFALCAVSTQGAAAGCESRFQEMRASDGGRLYTSAIPSTSGDPRKILDIFANVAKQRGYIVISPADVSGDVETLGIAKPPAPGPVMITANARASLVMVTSMVPAGSRADAVHERSVVCDLVNAFHAATHGSAGATARAAAHEDPSDDPSRTTLPTAIPKVNLVEPKSRFDAVGAREALKPGTSVIRGQACGGVKGAMAYASSVALFPATPYLEELLRLEKSAKAGRDRIVRDPDVLEVRMVAKTDAKGHFQFSRMKPGRYYLMTTISGLFGATRDVQVGRVEDAYGGANVYAKQDYTFDASSTIGKFVTVGRDGDVVDVTLQPPITANPFHRGMSGSVLGCRRLP